MLKWLALVFASLIALAAVAVLALPWLVDMPMLQAWLAQAGAQALGRPVTFTRVAVVPLPLPTVRVQGLRVAEEPAFGPGPLLTVGEARIGLRLWSLLRGQIEATELALTNVQLLVVEDASGRTNLSALAAPIPPAPAPARPGAPRPPAGPPAGVYAPQIRIVNAGVRYRKLGEREADVAVSQVNLAVTHDGAGDVLRVTGEGVAEPGGVRVTVVQGTVTPGSARTLVEMELAADLDVSAPDLGPLVRAMLVSPEAEGAARGRLTVKGTLGRPRVAGALTLERLTLLRESRRCGEPPRRRLSLEAVQVPLALTAPRLSSERVAAKLAGGTLSLSVLLELGRAPSATLKDVRLEGIQAAALLEDYLCQPWAVRGPLDLTGDLKVRAPDYQGGAVGSGRFKVGPGEVVGRDVTRVVDQVMALAGTASALLAPGRRGPDVAPLRFDAISGTYTVSDGLVRSEDLRYEGRGFQIAGAGTYALADGRVDLAVTFTQGGNQVRGTIAGPPGALRVTPTSVRIREGRDLKRLLDRLLR